MAPRQPCHGARLVVVARRPGSLFESLHLENALFTDNFTPRYAVTPPYLPTYLPTLPTYLTNNNVRQCLSTMVEKNLDSKAESVRDTRRPPSLFHTTNNL